MIPTKPLHLIGPFNTGMTPDIKHIFNNLGGFPLDSA
jgi:hypothetical protein